MQDQLLPTQLLTNGADRGAIQSGTMPVKRLGELRFKKKYPGESINPMTQDERYWLLPMLAAYFSQERRLETEEARSFLTGPWLPGISLLDAGKPLSASAEFSRPAIKVPIFVSAVSEPRGCPRSWSYANSYRPSLQPKW